MASCQPVTITRKPGQKCGLPMTWTAELCSCPGVAGPWLQTVTGDETLGNLLSTAKHRAQQAWARLPRSLGKLSDCPTPPGASLAKRVMHRGPSSLGRISWVKRSDTLGIWGSVASLFCSYFIGRTETHGWENHASALVWKCQLSSCCC